MSAHYTSNKVNNNITIVKRIDYINNYYGVGIFDKKNNSTTFVFNSEREADFHYKKLILDYAKQNESYHTDYIGDFQLNGKVVKF